MQLDFGDLTDARMEVTGTSSNSTRGVFGGGNNPSPSPDTKKNDYCYIASTLGNAIDFGDLSQLKRNMDVVHHQQDSWIICRWSSGTNNY